jgi:mono/diheme cytochrome c family protein
VPTRVFLAAAIVLAAAAAGGAGEMADANRQLFLRYCAACHGEDGKGGGEVAGALSKPPPDLTRLSRDNGGQFPLGRVIRAIDGRNVHRAHGRADMPVWGEVFADDPFVGDRFGVRIRVRRLAEHVRSIQEPGG